MLIQLVLALLIGIFAGTFTGLTPGIHINLVGVFLVSASAKILSSLNSIYLVVFIVSMAITHTFTDFIPSIFLGCPDTDTELSILPGHDLLKKGLGYEATVLTAFGGLAAIFILLIIAFPSILLVSKIYPIISKLIPYLLIISIVFLVILEKKKFTAILVIFLSGLLGWSVLNLPIKEPLLPLLTGLFGSSMLIMSIENKTKIPKQKITKAEINIIKPVIGSAIASPLCGFLPGLGSGQAAIIGNAISRTDKRGFLVLLGSTNTLVMGLSFIALYIIGKTRTGAAVAVKDLIGVLSWKLLILILAVILISGIVSFFLTISLAKFFSGKIEKINYATLSIATLFVLIVVVFLISGFYGILVLITSTLTGIYCISLKVKRTNMMGCLLIPTIILYLI